MVGRDFYKEDNLHEYVYLATHVEGGASVRFDRFGV